MQLLEGQRLPISEASGSSRVWLAAAQSPIRWSLIILPTLIFNCMGIIPTPVPRVDPAPSADLITLQYSLLEAILKVRKL
jgi:hypothetical protein